MLPKCSRFAFKRFQREDYARAAVADGVILAHDTGGGKGLALFIWPALKVGFKSLAEVGRKSLQPLAPVLLVVPGDLHQQVMAEAREKFGAQCTVLDSQDTFLHLSTVNPANGRRQLPPGYYLTSYTQLGSNGVQDPAPFNHSAPDEMMVRYGLAEADIRKWFLDRGKIHSLYYKWLAEHTPGLGPDASEAELHAAWRAAKSASKAEQHGIYDLAYETLRHYHHGARPSWAGLPPRSRQFIQNELLKDTHAAMIRGIGEKRYATQRPGATRCVFSPSLADLCQDTFACVAVDEGVRMKGEHTEIGLGVRQMNPRYRLVLTATPIKNRLPDIFWLAWWAAGGHALANARWPYPDDSESKLDFSQEFLVSERNLTKEELSETKRRYQKLTPQVCNVHRLWKLLAPVVLRRRKKDFGEDIVQKRRHLVRVPMGTRQAAVYQHHLLGAYADLNGKPALGARLQALRVAAADPSSELLRPHPSDKNSGLPYCSAPGGQPGLPGYTPKVAAALQIIDQILRRGEQVIVFSAFQSSLDTLSARLREADVPHCVLDSRTSQKKRGIIAADFKLGPGKSKYPVMLAGSDSMSEGHSFNLCSNVIRLSYSWAWDKQEQGDNRVHRLNSPKDVNIYSVICEGSIDRKLEALQMEKGDATELVLDGHLLGENTSEVNLAELLQIAYQEIRGAETLDESTLEKDWPRVRDSIRAAQSAWTNPVAHQPVADFTPQFNVEPPAPVTPPVNPITVGFNRIRFGFADPGEVVESNGFRFRMIGNFKRQRDAFAAREQHPGSICNPYLFGRLARGWSVFVKEQPSPLTQSVAVETNLGGLIPAVTNPIRPAAQPAPINSRVESRSAGGINPLVPKRVQRPMAELPLFQFAI